MNRDQDKKTESRDLLVSPLKTLFNRIEMVCQGDIHIPRVNFHSHH